MTELWFSFSGRATRSDYWLRFYLPFLAILILLSIVDSAMGTQISIGADPGVSLGVMSTIFNILAIWPSLAVSIKRLHDRDQSGWWLLMCFIPIIGAIYLFVVIGFLRGTVGENRFGPDPLGGEAAIDADIE